MREELRFAGRCFMTALAVGTLGTICAFALVLSTLTVIAFLL